MGVNLCVVSSQRPLAEDVISGLEEGALQGILFSGVLYAFRKADKNSA
jgi:hypothetical protein